MKTVLVGIAFLMAACSQQAASSGSPTSTSASPSPTASPSLSSSYAVLIKNFLTDPGSTYTLSIVASDGHIAATATARKRTVPNVQVGNLSTSTTAVYYLDGDSDVRFLRPDGSTGLATRITLGSKQAAAFAVSPDDSRIAVSVLDFTRYPVATRLYIEDLRGGNQIELFSSPNTMEWPVGWLGGQLVMAIGRNVQPQNYFDGFERARGYHVVSVQTGARLLTLCSGKESYVPVSAGAVVCIDIQTGSVTAWNGRGWKLPLAHRPDGASAKCSLIGPVSPTGVVATNLVSTQGGCIGRPDIYLVTKIGGIGANPVGTKASPVGWLDTTYLVTDPSSFTYTTTPLLSILNVSTGVTARVQAAGSFVAVLPGNL